MKTELKEVKSRLEALAGQKQGKRVLIPNLQVGAVYLYAERYMGEENFATTYHCLTMTAPELKKILKARRLSLLRDGQRYYEVKS